MEAPQGQPGADLPCVPDSDKSFVDFVAAQIGKIDVMDEILIDVVNKYSRLLMYCGKDSRHLLRSPHDEKYLVALRRQTVVKDVERSGYVWMG